MPINVKDFVIKSKVIQRAENEENTQSGGDSSSPCISESEKEELINDCMERVIAYLEKTQNHY